MWTMRTEHQFSHCNDEAANTQTNPGVCTHTKMTRARPRWGVEGTAEKEAPVFSETLESEKKILSYDRWINRQTDT